MREAVQVVGLQAHPLQQLHDLVRQVLLAAGELVDHQRLADQPADGVARVERGERVLEDDLHLPPQRPQRVALQRGDVLPLEPHVARGGLDQAHHAAPRGGFAAAGLAHHAERLAGCDIETDAVHRVHLAGHPRHHAAADREVLLEPADRKNRLSHE